MGGTRCHATCRSKRTRRAARNSNVSVYDISKQTRLKYLTWRDLHAQGINDPLLLAAEPRGPRIRIDAAQAPMAASKLRRTVSVRLHWSRALVVIVGPVFQLVCCLFGGRV